MSGQEIKEEDWKAVKKHFDSTRQQYQDLEGTPGVNTSFSLRMVFDPMSKRFNNGERTEELYNKMKGVK